MNHKRQKIGRSQMALVIVPRRAESPRLAAIMGRHCVFASPGETYELLEQSADVYSALIVDIGQVLAHSAGKYPYRSLIRFLSGLRAQAGEGCMILLRDTFERVQSGLSGRMCHRYQFDGYYTGRITPEVWGYMIEQDI